MAIVLHSAHKMNLIDKKYTVDYLTIYWIALIN